MNTTQDTKSRKLLTETKEAMRTKGKVGQAALHAANNYILKTYGIAI